MTLYRVHRSHGSQRVHLLRTGDLPQLGVRLPVPLGSGKYQDWRLLGFYEDGLDGTQRLGENRGW